MNVIAGFLYTSSAVWHGVNAYYYLAKPEACVKTYMLTGEGTDILAADVLSWLGGMQGALSVFALSSVVKLLSNGKLDFQVPFLLGSVALSQVATMRTEENWRPELYSLVIVNGLLSLGHFMLSFTVYRRSQANMLVGALDGIQRFINK